jgi:hypothetical protein
MAKLERNKTVLTPKVDKTGTQALKRETVEVERVEVEVDPNKELQLKKSRMRMIIAFFVLDLALFAVIIYQVVTIFMQIGSAATGTNA